MRTARKAFLSRFLNHKVIGVWIVVISAVAAAYASRADELYREWVRTYRLDPSRTNAASKMALTSDGIVVAGTSANTNGDSDYFLIKYRSNGEEAWKQRYGHAAGSDDRLRDLAIDPNGNVFVTGTSDTLKFNSDGNLLWTRPYAGRAMVADTNFVYVTGLSDTQFATVQVTNNNADGGTGWIRMFDATTNEDISAAITLSTNGSVLVAGWETVGFTTAKTPINKFLFVGYSSEGSVAWQITTDSLNGFPNRQQVYGFECDTFGSAYFLGSPDGGPPMMIRIDGGTVRWTHQWTYATTAYGMKVTPDRGVVCVGYNHDGAVSKYSPDGARFWDKSYVNEAGRQSTATCVSVLADGSIFVAGSTSRTLLDNDIFLLQLGSDGSYRVSLTYDSPQHGDDAATGIVVDKAGNVYVTGYSTTAEGGSEFVTIKYSPGGKAQCNVDGAIHVQFPGTPGIPYAIEATTNFVEWRGLITNTVDFTGFIQLDDTNSDATPFRFYRGKTSP